MFLRTYRSIGQGENISHSLERKKEREREKEKKKEREI
jgi:hypothetical protein